MFACDHDEVEPDILVMGKSLGGGILPIAAVIANENLDLAKEFAIGHYTHEKNPVTTTAALTTIKIIEDENLVENARSVGKHALLRLQEIKAKYDIIGDVRGRGFLMGMELVTDRETKEPANDAAETLYYSCLEKGVSFKLTMGNVVTLTPSLTLTKEQMDFALDAIDEGLNSFSKNLV